jgi:hypothetical protein
VIGIETVLEELEEFILDVLLLTILVLCIITGVGNYNKENNYGYD